MKNKLLLILSAAMVMLSLGVTVSADTVVVDAVYIIDVTDDGFLVCHEDGEYEVITYDLLTAAYLPRPIPEGVPPDPCLPIVRGWNKVIAKNMPVAWKEKQFRHLLRRMEKKGCRVLIEYEDVQPRPPVTDILAIQPDTP